MAEFMAAFAFGDAIIAALHDEQMIPDREQDALAPGHSLLQHFDKFEEAVRVLIGAHHPLCLCPGQGSRCQIANDVLAVARHRPTSSMPITKSVGKSQNVRKDSSKRGESAIALAYILRTSRAKSARWTR